MLFSVTMSIISIDSCRSDPIRCARSSACRASTSENGRLRNTTVEAAVRVIPTPPACVVASITRRCPAWNAATSASLVRGVWAPTTRANDTPSASSRAAASSISWRDGENTSTCWSGRSASTSASASTFHEPGSRMTCTWSGFSGSLLGSYSTRHGPAVIAMSPVSWVSTLITSSAEPSGRSAVMVAANSS